MSEEAGAHGFNENHQRRLRIAFQYIDKLLSEAEHSMADASSPSPFQEHSDDTTPIQRKVTHDYVLRIRETMRRIMEELEIPPSEPTSGAVWAAGESYVYFDFVERANGRAHAWLRGSFGRRGGET